MNIGQLFQFYIRDYASMRCRTAAKMQSNFNRYFDEMKDRPAAEVRPYDVQTWHNRLAIKCGEPTANRCLQLLRTLYNWGDKWELIECKNPARAVRKFKEAPRERFVTAQEMPRLLSAISKHGTYWTKDVFLLCLFTAQRLSNVCSMRWSDIDMASGQWKIPKGDFKTGSTHTVPLVDEALAILAKRRKVSEYVFPGRRNNRKHLDYPYNGWRKVLKVAGITDLRPHDLRRTHATYQVQAGETVPIIAKTLGHSDFTATAIYARAPITEVRRAMQGAVRAMRG